MLPPIDELMAMTDRQLDELKANEVEALLNSVGNIERVHKLAKLQWAIEGEIYEAPNKFAAMLKIKSLMNASLIELNDALQGVTPNA
tara:strand:- start:5083 stop:5343 length:261 start_codon:yes stop_codon:yes gene_type:complete